MTHSLRHPKSKFQWFRMDVPRRLQALAGTTSWRHSLGTTDPKIAAIKRAQLTAHYKAEVIRLSGMLAAAHVHEAKDLVDRAIEVLAARLGTLDAAIRANLLLIAHQARQSWSRQHALDASWDLGIIPTYDDEDVWNDNEPSEAFPGFDNEVERELFVARLRMLEHRGLADGIIYQEVAQRLLDRRAWRFVELPLLGLLHTVGVELAVCTPKYDAAAEHLLFRLATHKFTDWQPNVRAALAPVVSHDSEPACARAAPASPVVAALPNTTAAWSNAGTRSDPSQTLSAGLEKWKKSRSPGGSAVTEATRAVDRFIELYGDRHVASISDNDVFDYRDFITEMPRGLILPEIKASGRSLAEVVAERHAEEQAEHNRALASGRTPPRPKRLSPTSIKKDIGGLSAIFAALKSERWIRQNPAKDVPIDGYSKGRKVYPFRPEMMRKLFNSPLFTGCQGSRGKKRALAGPYVFQDAVYWSFLFAATAGHRMSEVGVALTENVEEAEGPNGEKIVGIFIMDAKNEHSQRVIIVHPRLLDLGFLDHVKERRRRGESYLFDLPGGGAKKLSERLNDYIDEVLIDDRRFVFHSMRHEFADRSEISIDVETSKKIMGHARGRLYGLGAPLHHAAAELNKVDMSFIDWDRLIEAARTRKAAA